MKKSCGLKERLCGGDHQHLTDVDQIGRLQAVGAGDSGKLGACAIEVVGDVPQAVTGYHGVRGSRRRHQRVRRALRQAALQAWQAPRRGLRP